MRLRNNGIVKKELVNHSDVFRKTWSSRRVEASVVVNLCEYNKPLLKRPFDIILSGFGLIMSSLLWALISIVIIIEDGFPVIIKQQRIGKYGKLFWGYKFRSMKKQTLDEKVSIQACENDPRVTRIGRLLRRCAMDELPQLLNIFLGDMSFVGPRALLPKEQEVNTSRQYTNGGICDITTIPGFNERILVKPGLTGIAPIWAPRDIMRRQKFKYDLLYIKKMSFWLDLKLILLSFLVTFNSAWESSGAKLKTLTIRGSKLETLAIRSTERQAWEKEYAGEQGRKGAEEKRRIKDYILNWLPVA